MSQSDRIAAARARLREIAETHPDSVTRIEARIALLTAAEKRQRERERVDHLVLGKPREMSKPVKAKRQGRRKTVAKAQPVPLSPGLDEAVVMRERWSHKTHGTAETHEHAVRTHQGALVQLHANGTIDSEQLEWAAEIANVYRSLQADVAVAIASLEARVDQSRSGRDAAAESVRRVRLHVAYGYWREQLSAPKRLVLDMIVGDAVGYTVAARRYGVHNRKAKRLLLSAIDRWPDCVARAYRAITSQRLEAAE